VTVPRVEEDFSQPLPLALGRDHHVHAPGCVDFLAVDTQPHGHRRVLTDDASLVSRDPDLRLANIRVLAVLPLPALRARLGGHGTEHTAEERIDFVAILRAVLIDDHADILG
jgi:hypothetical protein